MKIRHQYNSATPYESCGYEVVPAYPCEGERVTIKCRTEPYSEGEQLRLLWSMDGVAQRAIAGELCHVDEDGRGYYSFALPELKGTSNVDYTIEAKVSGEIITSEAYSFAPMRVENLCRATGLWKKDDELLFLFEIGGKSFYWSWNISDSMVAMRLFEKRQEPSAQFTEVTKNAISARYGKDRYIEVRKAPFEVHITDNEGCVMSISGRSISIAVDSVGCIRRVKINALAAGTAFYGLGERFNTINQLNHSVKAYSYEKFTNQGERSYMPVPFFVSDKGYGFFHRSGYQADYKFSQCEQYGGQSAMLELSLLCGDNDCVSEDFMLFGKINEVVSRYIELTGKPVLPPRWSFGPWMSSNRWENQSHVEQQLEAMERYKIPATVLVIERWSDDTIFDCFEDVPRPTVGGGDSLSCKDFSFSQSKRWNDPVGMTKRIHDMGMKLILWQAPIIRKPTDKAYPQCDNDYAYAIENKYCVMMKDGSPYRCPEGWFKNSLLVDFTSDEAVKWWMSKRKWLLSELHADGFKTDSGELVVDDRCIFSNGKSGQEMRNVYPMYYEKAYADFLSDNGVDGVNFTRAGYYGAQKYPIHWTGDQKSTFPELRAQLVASLSAGLSGVLFMGTDLAGFAGDLPTGELYRRGVSFAAFSGLMQFHSEPTTGFNNDRSPWNMAACLHDPDIINYYRRYAELRMSLMPYLYSEGRHCVESGRPLMAHLMFDFENDENVKDIEDSYMLGRSLLVAPVVHEGSVGRDIYFPSGEWVDLFSGELFSVGTHFYPCDTESIPVFIKKGSMLPLDLDERFITAKKEDARRAVANCGQCLSFLCTGDGEHEYTDEAGRPVKIKIEKDCAHISSGGASGYAALFALAGCKLKEAFVNGKKAEISEVKCTGEQSSVSGILLKL